ncbi:MAG: hypothetical protein ACFFER_01170 [Candidatus Thorarchaeota archaeon]
MSDDEELHTSLSALVRIVEEKKQAWKTEGIPKLEDPITGWKQGAYELGNWDLPSKLRRDLIHSRYRQDLWDYKRQIINSLVETDPYKTCNKLIDENEKYKEASPDDDSLTSLDAFVGEVLVRLHEDVQDLDLFAGEQSSLFITEIAGGEIEYVVTTFLEGLECKNEITLLPYRIELHPPTTSQTGVEPKCDCILRVVVEAKNEDEVINLLHLFLGILRLYRVSTMRVIRTDFHPVSFLKSHPYYRYNWNWFSGLAKSITYALGDNPRSDRESLSQTMDKLELSLSRIIYKQDQDGGYGVYPLIVAFERYIDALTHARRTDERIAFTVFCLEALLLTKNERGELMHRLAQRAAIVLGIHALTPKDVRDNLRKAYTIRNTYVHGAQDAEEKTREISGKKKSLKRTKKKKEEEKEELASIALDYARILLQILMQCKSNEDHSLCSKDKLIKLIDDALVSNTDFEKLKEIIEPVHVTYFG